MITFEPQTIFFLIVPSLNFIASKTKMFLHIGEEFYLYSIEYDFSQSNYKFRNKIKTIDFHLKRV